jgi:hypothetical protein
MCLNHIGYIVAQEWVRSSQIRQEIELDEWVIMPNHIHGIVLITDINTVGNTVGAQGLAPLHLPTTSNPVAVHRQPRSLSSSSLGSNLPSPNALILSAKHQAFLSGNAITTNVSVRDEKSLHTIRQYIINNPQRWSDDPENPQHYPENQQLLIDLPF